MQAPLMYQSGDLRDLELQEFGRKMVFSRNLPVDSFLSFVASQLSISMRLDRKHP